MNMASVYLVINMLGNIRDVKKQNNLSYSCLKRKRSKFPKFLNKLPMERLKLFQHTLHQMSDDSDTVCEYKQNCGFTLIFHIRHSSLRLKAASISKVTSHEVRLLRYAVYTPTPLCTCLSSRIMRIETKIGGHLEKKSYLRAMA